MNVSRLLSSTTLTFLTITCYHFEHSWATGVQHGWGIETEQQVVKVFFLIVLQADTSDMHRNCSQTHFYVA